MIARVVMRDWVLVMSALQRHERPRGDERLGIGNERTATL
jgi:hypothetical protein